MCSAVQRKQPQTCAYHSIVLQGPAATAVNAGLFSQSKENLQMLLVLLEDAPMGVPDFYVRYHTVQILTALAAVASSRVQEVH